MEALDNLDL